MDVFTAHRDLDNIFANKSAAAYC